MGFKLSKRSLSKLEGVHPDLVKVVKSAITLTEVVDFGVICGMRNKKEQLALVKSGASQTMNSFHLPQASDGYSHAVDLMAYVSDGNGGSRASWELNVYDDIADAMKKACIQHGVSVTWGAAWTIKNIAEWEGTMEEAMNSYIDARRNGTLKRRCFLDGPHFQLS